MRRFDLNEVLLDLRALMPRFQRMFGKGEVLSSGEDAPSAGAAAPPRARPAPSTSPARAWRARVRTRWRRHWPKRSDSWSRGTSSPPSGARGHDGQCERTHARSSWRVRGVVSRHTPAAQRRSRPPASPIPQARVRPICAPSTRKPPVRNRARCPAVKWSIGSISAPSPERSCASCRRSAYAAVTRPCAPSPS